MSFEDMTPGMLRRLYDAAETFENGPRSHDDMVHMVRDIKAAITPQVIATDDELMDFWDPRKGDVLLLGRRRIAADTYKRCAKEAVQCEFPGLATHFRDLAAQALKGTP